MSIREEIFTGLMLIRIWREPKASRATLEKVEDHRMRTTALIRNKMKPYGLYIVDDKINELTIELILGPKWGSELQEAYHKAADRNIMRAADGLRHSALLSIEGIII
jgi:hypothetical protein